MIGRHWDIDPRRHNGMLLLGFECVDLIGPFAYERKSDGAFVFVDLVASVPDYVFNIWFAEIMEGKPVTDEWLKYVLFTSNGR